MTDIEEAVELQTVRRDIADVTQTAVMEAEVTEIAGTITVAGGGSVTSVVFRAGRRDSSFGFRSQRARPSMP